MDGSALPLWILCSQETAWSLQWLGWKEGEEAKTLVSEMRVWNGLLRPSGLTPKKVDASDFVAVRCEMSSAGGRRAESKLRAYTMIKFTYDSRSDHPKGWCMVRILDPSSHFTVRCPLSRVSAMRTELQLRLRRCLPPIKTQPHQQQNNSLREQGMVFLSIKLEHDGKSLTEVLMDSYAMCSTHDNLTALTFA
jgi:hypothetical protein